MPFFISISLGSRNQAKLFISVNSSDCKERAREIKEFLISEYAIIFTKEDAKLWEDVKDLEKFIERETLRKGVYETLNTFEGFFQNLMIVSQRYA